MAKSKQIQGPKSTGRFKGVSVSQDAKGVFVHTHRVRAKSRASMKVIPDSEIRRIRATG